ncbi:MAG TPA: VWA domain-containing protein [Vicinamibacterales bacterium]|nr:VWA domain-containing protein [Vicinamibacterales bacterium]
MLTWTAPAALWLLALVPLVWLAPLVARTTFNPRQRVLQAAARSLLLAALALAIARPVLSTSSPRQSIVYVVDVSHSIASRAIEEAARTIDEMNGNLRPAWSRILVFGSTTATVSDTAALRRLAPIDGAPETQPVDRSGSDLEAALNAARGQLAPDSTPRVILFTDGHSTEGAVENAIARLQGAHIPVFVEPMVVRSLGDAWIDRIDLPERIAAGGTFAATVAVGAQRAGSGTVTLRADGAVVATREVALRQGLTPVVLEGQIDSAGSHVLAASLSLANDPLAANNTLEVAAEIMPRARVLYVEGAPQSARYLTSALRDAGFDVVVKPPAGVPASAAALDALDVVVLSDVARSAIPDPAIAALTQWVEKGGGGLLVAGGESVFGEAGYQKSAIERISPVTFERKDEPEVALVLVLDRSWSMAGPSIDLCKAAAQAAVDVLTDKQVVGIITFNDQYDWNVPLSTVGQNRAGIREKIAGIVPSGPTRIYPAVEQAYVALRSTKARAKHVVVLSDGRSLPDDHESLVRKMAEAHITVSSVAVGPAADRELLHNIAVWGKGRDYTVQNAKELPEVFVKEAKNAATPSFDEKDITPVVKAPAFLGAVDAAHAPKLKGITATVLKDTALEVMSTDEGDPLLAFWPIGLGRTAVFASDVKDRWATNWIKWRGYGPFFAAVVHAIERQRPRLLDLEAVAGPIDQGRREIRVSIEARDQNGGYRDLLRPTVTVSSEQGRTANVSLRQVAPGRYEATVLADAGRPVTLTTTDPTGTISRVVVADSAAEYRFRPTDEALLRSIASATGGSWKPELSQLAAAPTDRHSERRPLWPALTIAALCLWFVDLLLRRIRVFEPKVNTVNAEG